MIDITIPEMPDSLALSAPAAWRAGWLAGYDAALAKVEAILQRASDAEDAERAEGAPA